MQERESQETESLVVTLVVACHTAEDHVWGPVASSYTLGVGGRK